MEKQKNRINNPSDAQRCKAKAKSTGQRCERWAVEGRTVCPVHGAGTKKRVKAGTKIDPREATLKTGRFSKLKNERIKALIEQHEADDNPLNILPELAAARAIFEDFVNRHEEYTQALLAWYKSFESSPKIGSTKGLAAIERICDQFETLASRNDELDEGIEEDIGVARGLVSVIRSSISDSRPRTVLDISEAGKLIFQVTAIAERHEKIQMMSAISRNEIGRIMSEMGKVVAKHVESEAVQEAIANEWSEIRI